MCSFGLPVDRSIDSIDCCMPPGQRNACHVLLNFARCLTMLLLRRLVRPLSKRRRFRTCLPSSWRFLEVEKRLPVVSWPSLPGLTSTHAPAIDERKKNIPTPAPRNSARTAAHSEARCFGEGQHDVAGGPLLSHTPVIHPLHRSVGFLFF